MCHSCRMETACYIGNPLETIIVSSWAIWFPGTSQGNNKSNMQGADTQRCVNGEQSWPEGSQGAKRHTHRLAASKYLRHSRRAGHDGEGGDRQKGDGEATWRAGRWARRQGGRQLGWGWLPQCQVGMGRLPQHTMPCMLCCCCRPLRVAAGSAHLHYSLVVCTAGASEPAQLNGGRQGVV